MPDPREAVYDVLLAKKRRREDQEKRKGELAAWYAEWEKYEEDNARANAVARGTR